MSTGGAAAAVSRRTAAPLRKSKDEDSLHERLVAYVHTLAHGSRRGVWGEHAYARARGVGVRGEAPRVLAMLAPRAPRPASPLVDVERAPSPPRSPPARAPPSPPPADDDDTDASDGEWEERVAAGAPSAAHARLADVAADALRRMRLARLVGAGRSARREQARDAARRLRRALAPLWAHGGAPAWLHGALAAHLPRAERRLYDEALAELRRSVPRLAERMAGPGVPRSPSAAPAGAAVGPDSSPWLVWVSSGSAALDARWEPRLAALVHTRVLRGTAGAPGVDAAAPEPWCAAAAGAVRAALTDALAEAGSRSVILGGAGAGCAAALVLARGAGGAGRAEGGVRGCVLAAPPLLTAEGARGAPDDALAACRLPLLLVAGTHAADCARALANQLCEGGAGARRLLEVRGADGELRLPARLRVRHRLPQHALDAALVEECVRWAVETAELEEPPASPPAAAERRRAPPPLPALVREIDLTEEEYAHLPPAAPPAPPAAPAPAPPALSPADPPLKPREVGKQSPAPRDPCVTTDRGNLTSKGRVVSRVSGGTPLALLPPAPRRAPAPAPGAGPGGSGGSGGALAAADIMQLPIVFADDEAAAAPPLAALGEEAGGAGAGAGGSVLTVTSGKPGKRGGAGGAGGAGGVGGVGGVGGAGGGEGGAAADSGSVKFTRVILAKRGARGAGAAAGAGAGAPRRLLLRRGVRLVQRRP